jgi:hypothetical protein
MEGFRVMADKKHLPSLDKPLRSGCRKAHWLTYDPADRIWSRRNVCRSKLIADIHLVRMWMVFVVCVIPKIDDPLASIISHSSRFRILVTPFINAAFLDSSQECRIFDLDSGISLADGFEPVDRCGLEIWRHQKVFAVSRCTSANVFMKDKLRNDDSNGQSERYRFLIQSSQSPW